MSQPLDPTRPASPVDQFQYAVHLAKAGRKIEARDALRKVVAAQPVNQAAWLWLSAVAPELAEAEAALAQARSINPLHPSLAQAEQWLAKRFATQPSSRVTILPAPAPTKPTKIATTQPMPSFTQTHKPATLPMEDSRPHQAATLPMPSPQPPASVTRPFKLSSQTFHLIALIVVAVAATTGLGVLFLGLTLPVGATAPEPAPIDSFLRERPAALDEAWASRDWGRAIAILEGLRQTQPESAALKEQLTHAYLQQGIALRHKGFIEEARPMFEQALRLTPGQLRARQEDRLAANYLQGVKHYQAGEWQKAIESLEAVRAEDGAYVHVKDLLYSAYYNHGLALQGANKMKQARDALEMAIALRPDLPEPRREIADIEFALAPQTAPEKPIPPALVKDRLIVVGIAEQRMWVFDKNKQVFDFVVSTGEPGRDTAIGEFEILDKIDVAYAATWNLDMPYWMGIYWAGTLENGIHSLPIVKHTGYKLWDGYLGQRVSYGCVILSDEDAATLYEWAEVGTKVKIVWSLADWAGE
ncbi:MAG: L,D-transpeptidase family protein [Anaerolineales bacterium]|nr:L,D-transpeptidase family protein [Anaerolineales bacterium]